MDRLLLIMPFFMGYHEILRDYLSARYEVTLVDGDQYIAEIRRRYDQHKILRHIGYHVQYVEDAFKEWLTRDRSSSLIDKTVLEQDYRYIVVINGHGISEASYRALRRNNSQAKFILFLWDDTKNLFKQSHIKHFDAVYSYNISDCRKYHGTYLPVFMKNTDVFPLKKDIDISFIASAHSDRIQFAEALYNRYKDKYTLFFYFYDPSGQCDFFSHKEPLCYDEYIAILKRSRITVDLPSSIQEGPTSRVCDSIATKTKIITCNKKLVEYPFFSQNICFVDRKDPVIEKRFLDTDYCDIAFEPVPISKWVEALGL